MAEREKTVLVVGSGGREASITEHIAASFQVKRVLVAPGIADPDSIGLKHNKEVRNMGLPHNNVCDIIDICRRLGVSMVVVGPEAWLEKELGDVLAEEGIPAIAPQKNRAMLELDKAYARNKCSEWGIPQPKYEVFVDPQEAKIFIEQRNLQEGVIKVSGPALGKGVEVCETQEAMLNAVKNARARFGSAADKILWEERLTGIEVSYIVLSDGKTFMPLTPAMDYKRLMDGDLGPNTGGLGSIAPNPYVTDEIAAEIERKIIWPAIEGMRGEGVPYKGILYAGVMLTDRGPQLLEFNARGGDPETQSQLPLLPIDFYYLLEQVTKEELYKCMFLKGKELAAVTVVLAADGYPNNPRKGDVIHGLQHDLGSNVSVYLAGAKKIGENFVTNGGRVANITAVASNLETARKLAYRPIDENIIYFEGMHFRKDIGRRKDE